MILAACIYPSVKIWTVYSILRNILHFLSHYIYKIPCITSYEFVNNPELQSVEYSYNWNYNIGEELQEKNE